MLGQEKILDTPPVAPVAQGPSPAPLAPAVVTTPDGFDNFDLGVNFAEPHMSSHPDNPLWVFNAWNTNGTHRTTNGHDWVSSTPGFGSGFFMRGDPITAYDSIGNLYYENMFSVTSGGSIVGCKVMRSTDNGATWTASVTAIDGVDKNWIACDQTSGPFANYVYTVMTNSSGGNFARSTDFGSTWTSTFEPPEQSLPGMMVAVGPNVLGGNNISGGCVYVVTNSGSSFAATYTFHRSTDGGLTFTQMSAQNYANYVGTNVSGRNSVQNMRTRPYPFIAADNSFGPYRGRLYLVYASNTPAGDGNKPDIFCRYSTNQGATWSSAILVNDDPGTTNNHQWHPSIWCDKETGRLYAKWLDTRNVPASDSADVYASYSDNGGVTWVTNQRITNARMRINCTTCGGGGTPRYQGDYDAVTSNGNTSMLVWADFRNGTFGSYTAYFPDFAMLVSPTATTIANTDSANIIVRVPAVKLYTASAKFSATVSPAAAFTFEFPEGDSLTGYPDSLTMKIKTTGVANGAYTVTVTGQGPNGTPVHRRTIAVTVQSPSVTLLTPNGGESWQVGSTKTIAWSSFAFTTGVNIVLSRDAGVTFPETLFTNVTNDGSQNWIVSGPLTAAARMKIFSAANPAIADVSVFNFSVVQAVITLANPNGGDLLAVGSSLSISWSSSFMSGPLRILLSRDGGLAYPETLFANTSNDGSQLWTVTGPLTSTARIKVESIDIPGVFDTSNSDFNIVQPTIAMTLPDGGEVWEVGSTQTIQWGSTDLTGNVRIELSRNGGVSYAEILFSSIPDDGSETWVVDVHPTGSARIRVTALGAPGVADASEADFSISQFVSIVPGWNLVSSPLIMTDPGVTSVFPSAVSDAFQYTSLGYVPQDSLENGEGYWIKFDSTKSVSLTGLLKERDTVSVSQGWGLLGSISFSATVDSIVQNPAGIIVAVFSYQPGLGYQSDPATIEPGQAVWIKTSQAGTLILKRQGSTPPAMLQGLLPARRR